MSYEEKGQWVYLVATAVAYGGYLVLMLGGAGTSPLPEIDYQPILLGSIGVGIAGSIIGRIAIEIVRPSESHREADHFWIANAIYLVFVAQAMVGAVIKLIAYRRGF